MMTGSFRLIDVDLGGSFRLIAFVSSGYGKTRISEEASVTTVENGRRALEVLGVGDGSTSGTVNAYQIKLIITDYCMPGMSGYDLLKKLKQTAGVKEIPVVIMSSENIPNLIRRCLAEGAEEFILKPVQLADIKRLGEHVH